MATPLAIAAVSRVLRQLVEASVVENALDGFLQGDVFVTAEPPREDPARMRVNLFMYQALESGHWRNDGQPAHDGTGRRLNNPPLALDLHYAVTAYAQDDLQSELLLGCAMHALHRTPSLDRQLVLDILGLDPADRSLIGSRLAEQVDRIRIRHRNLTEEAFARLWSAFHVPYRASAFYQVSVVFIQDEEPRRVPMVVLRRPEPVVHPSLTPAVPSLVAVAPPAALTGETVVVSGLNLAGASQQVHARHQDPSVVLPPLDIVPPAVGSPDEIRFEVPAAWPIGFYDLHVTTVPDGANGPRPSNALPFAVAPTFTVTQLQRDPNPPGLVALELDVTPPLRPAQKAAFILGSREIVAPQVTAPTGHLRFEGFEVPPGPAVGRLRVERTESRWLDRDATPPTILPEAMLEVP